MRTIVTRLELKGLSKHDLARRRPYGTGCGVCPLSGLRLHHPRMDPTGSDRPLLYVLGEAPGAQEDEAGKQFVGKSGQRLRGLLSREVLKRVRWNNAVRCRPPGNRTPTPAELACCAASITNDIEATRPRVVLLVGNVALRWAFGTMDGIKRWRGRIVPLKVKEHTCWAYPILHPSFIQRVRAAKDEQGIGEEWGPIFDRDVARAVECAFGKKGPKPVVEACSEDGIQLFPACDRESAERVEQLLLLWHGQRIAIDLETKNLRPYSSGSKVLTVALSDGERTLAFPIDHPTASWPLLFRAPVLKALRQTLIRARRVIAHNAAFEMEWLAWLLGPDLLRKVRWACTMQQAYVLDERPGGTGLDFLCRLRFGFALKAVSKVNRLRLDRAPIEQVLRYNALDAKYTARLYPIQRGAIVADGLLPAYGMQMRRLPTLVHAQRIGVLVDQGVVAKLNKRCLAKEAQLGQQILSEPEAKRFRRVTGQILNPSSPKQLAVLLRDIAKCTEGARVGGGYSTDKETLKAIKLPVAKLVLEYRGVTKLRSTYIVGVMPKGEYLYPDGRLHTQYKTAFTATGRLSSEDPNLQNWPMREHPEIREQVCAPPGQVMVAVDYGQLEPRLIAAASQDPYLMKALKNRYDVHLDWTHRVAEAHPPSMKPYFDGAENEGAGWKAMRTDVKSYWVLAGFYNSSMNQMARRYNLPSVIGTRLYREFWEMFAGVRRWQETMARQYARYGYVQMLTGRRRHGPLTRPMIVNSTIQGAASDLVVEASNRLSVKAEQEGKPYLQCVLNIHDDLTFYCPKKNLRRIVGEITGVMLHPTYEWLNVPLTVEVKAGPNWYDLKKIGVYSSDERPTSS